MSRGLPRRKVHLAFQKRLSQKCTQTLKSLGPVQLHNAACIGEMKDAPPHSRAWSQSNAQSAHAALGGGQLVIKIQAFIIGM